MFIYYGIIIFLLIIYLLVPEKFLKIEDRNLHQKFTTDHIPPALGGYFLILTLIGGSVLSSTSGIKFLRIYILIKAFLVEIYRLVKPNLILNTKIMFSEKGIQI